MPKAVPESKAAKPLTRRQRQFYAAIVAHFRKHGMPPTLREIGRKFGIQSPNGVRGHLKLIAAKGYLHDSNGTTRGVMPVGLLPYIVAAVRRFEKGQSP